jgi:hypothetical protein
MISLFDGWDLVALGWRVLRDCSRLPVGLTLLEVATVASLPAPAALVWIWRALWILSAWCFALAARSGPEGCGAGQLARSGCPGRIWSAWRSSWDFVALELAGVVDLVGLVALILAVFFSG